MKVIDIPNVIYINKSKQDNKNEMRSMGLRLATRSGNVADT